MRLSPLAATGITPIAQVARHVILAGFEAMCPSDEACKAYLPPPPAPPRDVAALQQSGGLVAPRVRKLMGIVEVKFGIVANGLWFFV